MAKDFTYAEKYLLDQLGIQAKVTGAYLLKVGYLRLEFTDDFGNLVNSDQKAEYIKRYRDELYKCLSDSPHIMEISPDKSDFDPDKRSRSKMPVWYRFWATKKVESLSMSQYLKCRVVLPRKKRDELFHPFLPTIWNPEEFTIYFNGAIFVAVTPITSFPEFSEVGQVAREFLADALGKSDIWEYKDGFGPTPIHPDFYLLEAEIVAPDSQAGQLPAYPYKRNDVIALLPPDLSLDRFMKSFLNNINTGIEDFYRCVVTEVALFHATQETQSENQHLTELLADYFDQSTFGRLFANVTGEIRKTLGRMHMTLFEISTLEVQLAKDRTEAIESITKSPLLNPVIDYFKSHTVEDQEFDRNAQLTAMNFAAEETSNSAINRSTLFAAFIGGLVGGIITILAQLLIK